MSNPWGDVERRLDDLQEEADDEPSDADRWRAFVNYWKERAEDDASDGTESDSDDRREWQEFEP